MASCARGLPIYLSRWFCSSSQRSRRGAKSRWALRSSQQAPTGKVEHPTSQSAVLRVNGRSWTRSYFGRTWTQRTAFLLGERCCYLSVFNFVPGWAGQIYIKIIIIKKNTKTHRKQAFRCSGKDTSHHSRTAVHVIELRHPSQTEAKTNEAKQHQFRRPTSTHLRFITSNNLM